MTPSLVSGELASITGSAGQRSLVRMSNPLSSELDVLRPDMITGGLTAIAYNLNRKNQYVRFFERGKTYELNGDTHHEEQRISLFLSGKHDVQIWRATSKDMELADVKAELEMLIHRCEVRDIVVRPVSHPLLVQAHELVAGKQIIARFGTVRPSLATRQGVEQPVFFGEVLVETLVAIRAKQTLEYVHIAKYPSVRRDLSILLDHSVRFEDLKDAAFRHEKGLLKEVGLFDNFEGKNLPTGKKSYCLSFILQDENKTLTDSRIDKTMDKLFRIYEKEFGAEMR
jgi:phenylalanyl-tRNA synthetase beta chain